MEEIFLSLSHLALLGGWGGKGGVFGGELAQTPHACSQQLPFVCRSGAHFFKSSLPPQIPFFHLWSHTFQTPLLFL